LPSWITVGTPYDVMLIPKDFRIITSKFGLVEPEVKEFIQEAMKEADIFIDVGGYGYYTLMASKLMKHEAVIMVFEPDPTAFAVLQANLAINDVSKVKLYQVALSDSEGFIEISKYTPGANKIIANGARLDLILKNQHLNVSGKTLIKIDVEGAAVSVLKGATETLKQKPKLVVELHSGEENVECLLKNYDYTIEHPSNHFLIAYE